MHSDGGSPVPIKKCSCTLYSLLQFYELSRVRHPSLLKSHLKARGWAKISRVCRMAQRCRGVASRLRCCSTRRARFRIRAKTESYLFATVSCWALRAGVGRHVAIWRDKEALF